MLGEVRNRNGTVPFYPSWERFRKSIIPTGSERFFYCSERIGSCDVRYIRYPSERIFFGGGAGKEQAVRGGGEVRFQFGRLKYQC